MTVRGRSKSIIKYAFLDNSSNAVFFTESFTVIGVATWTERPENQDISVCQLWNTRKNIMDVDSLIIPNLLVSDLEENKPVHPLIPTLYTRPEIPVSSDDIITQDIDQWSYLQGVFIPNDCAEVGLYTHCY